MMFGWNGLGLRKMGGAVVDNGWVTRCSTVVFFFLVFNLIIWVFFWFEV